MIMKKIKVFYRILFLQLILCYTFSSAGFQYTDTRQNFPEDSIYPLLKQNIYKIALVFPFELSHIFSPDYRQSAISKTAQEFYMGLLIAAEELENENLPFTIEIKTYDITAEDSLPDILVKRLISDHPDIIIGHLSRFNSEDFLIISKTLKSPLISPFYADENNLKNNPYFITLKSTDLHVKRLISQYIYKNFLHYNLIFLCPNTQQLNEFSETLKNTGQISNLKNFSGFTVNSANWSSTDYLDVLDDSNLIVSNILNDMVAINSLLNNLSKNKDRHIQMLIPREWLNYQTIELTQLSELHAICYAEPQLSYADTNHFPFITKFREKYKTEASDISFKGYKTFKYIVNALASEGKYIQRSKDVDLFNLKKTEGNKGFQNNNLTLEEIINYKLIYIDTITD